jgi:hypothetical protein
MRDHEFELGQLQLPALIMHSSFPQASSHFSAASPLVGAEHCDESALIAELHQMFGKTGVQALAQIIARTQRIVPGAEKEFSAASAGADEQVTYLRTSPGSSPSHNPPSYSSDTPLAAVGLIVGEDGSSGISSQAEKFSALPPLCRKKYFVSFFCTVVTAKR